MGTPKTPKENRQNSSLRDKDGDELRYGNKDDKDEKLFKAKFGNHFVVRHSKLEVLGSGAAVEDPRSVYYQFYEVDDFERMTEQKVIDGKQYPSLLDNLGLTVKVLHDPKTIE